MKTIAKLQLKDILLLGIVIICLVASFFFYLKKDFSFVEDKNTTEKESPNRDSYNKIEKSDDGKIIVRMFFDENGNAVMEENGYYGFIDEKDDNKRLVKRIFVDENKNPTNIKQGYSIIKYYYNENGSASTELYFDKDGNHARIANGAYGIKRQDGKILYVDKNGDVILNIENIAAEYPVIIVTIGAIICILLLLFRDKKPVVICFLTIYLFFIIYITLIRSQGRSVAYEPFRAYKSFFTSYGSRVSILNNIWLFAPLAAAIRFFSHKKWMIALPIVFSILIELTQLVFGLGIFEFDDIISNSLGSGIGLLMAYEFERIVLCFKQNKQLKAVQKDV